jgi:hypothetical protein
MPQGAAYAVKPEGGLLCCASPYGDRAAFRGWLEASGRRASQKNLDGLRRVEQRAVLRRHPVD